MFFKPTDRLAKVRNRLQKEQNLGQKPRTRLSVPRLALRIFHVAILVFGVIVVVGWYFLVGPSAHLHGSVFNHNQNAVWAQHAWVDQPHTPEEIRGFVENLGAHGVRYVFLHVGPLESDGTIPPARYKELGEFLRVSHEYGDRLTFIPWLGQLRSKLPLQQLQVRKNIVHTAQIFVNDFGMKGVHYDIEPIVDGDTDFLFLLEDTRKALGSDALISVALPEMVPDYVFSVARRFMDLKSFLSTDMYREVAARANQITVMTYENSIKSAKVYEYFLKNEVIWITQLLADQPVRILIGLPTYDKPTESFHPEAENIRAGLLGVIDGLNNWRSKKELFEGVALYGAWTTDASEWKTMETLFLKKP